MDFPDGPVAIHSSKTTYSDLTKSASPNELINPEISMKKHHIFYIQFSVQITLITSMTHSHNNRTSEDYEKTADPEPTFMGNLCTGRELGKIG